MLHNPLEMFSNMQDKRQVTVATQAVRHSENSQSGYFAQISLLSSFNPFPGVKKRTFLCVYLKNFVTPILMGEIVRNKALIVA